MNNTCVVCKRVIQVMCRKGTGLCGELCEKKQKQIIKDNTEAFQKELLPIG